MSFISGAYTATLDAATVGQIQQGIRISHDITKQIIVGDNFGPGTAQDAVFQGQNVFVAYTLMEYNAASARLAFWPYGSAWLTQSTPVGAMDVASSLIKQLILTSTAGTPAAAAPTSITLARCALTGGSELNFEPALRVAPIRQQVYPTASGTTATFGTLT